MADAGLALMLGEVLPFGERGQVDLGPLEIVLDAVLLVPDPAG